MEPVRIRLYGLKSVTRRGYLVQLIISIGLLLALLVIGFVMPPLPAEEVNDRPSLVMVTTLLNHLPWIALVLAILLGLEAVLVLRRFAREEARQRAQDEAIKPAESQRM
jgi:hypothetical protein